MAFISGFQNLDLYYEEYGERDHPTVVLIHGRGGNATIWWQQVRTLSQRLHVLAIDLRGFGRSKCAGPVTFDREVWVEDLKCLLDGLSIERAAFVGHSSGAVPIADFGLRYPDRVSCAVMSGSVGGAIDPKILELWLKITEETKHIPITTKSFAPGYTERNKEAHSLYCSIRNFNPVTDDQILYRLSPKPTLDVSLLRTVRFPVLLMRGEHDVYMSSEILSYVKGFLPRCEIFIQPGVGHSTYYEDPKTFNERVLEFIGGNS